MGQPRTVLTAACLGLLFSVPCVRAQTNATPAVPVLRIGDAFTIRPSFRSQLDWSSPPDAEADRFDVSRARLGLAGTAFGRLEYQVSRELRSVAHPWRDAYVDVRIRRTLQVQGGRFKVPFGLDALTSGTDLDFVHRPLVSPLLAPGRDVGLGLHGRAGRREVRYEVALFRGPGDQVRAHEHDDPAHGPLLAGRVTFRPLRHTHLKGLAVGSAFTSGQTPEGLYSLPGEMTSGATLFPAVRVRGNRTRSGFDARWVDGPASLSAELVHGRDQRLGLGTDDDDLAPVVTRGWYVSGTWILTGERKRERLVPARPFLGGGAGAIELAARVERVRQGSNGAPVPASSDTRARTILERSDRALTVGVTWYANRFLKLQANAIRERLDVAGAPQSAGPPAWARVLRLQVQL